MLLSLLTLLVQLGLISEENESDGSTLMAGPLSEGWG